MPTLQLYMVFKRYLFCLHLFVHTSFALIIPETYSYVLEITWCIMILLAFQTMEALFSDRFNIKYYTRRLAPVCRDYTSPSFLLTGITSLTFIHR